jgi:hypothetical protein
VKFGISPGFTWYGWRQLVELRDGAMGFEK